MQKQKINTFFYRFKSETEFLKILKLIILISFNSLIQIISFKLYSFSFLSTILIALQVTN